LPHLNLPGFSKSQWNFLWRLIERPSVPRGGNEGAEDIGSSRGGEGSDEEGEGEEGEDEDEDEDEEDPHENRRSIAWMLEYALPRLKAGRSACSCS